MKYTLEQRLDIGRRIYEGELTRFQAAEEYGINDNTARNYMWLYRDTNQLIQALIQTRITEARLKKGYEVKGDGSVIHYSSKNIK